MQKDFITATPDSGGSGSTTVTVAASANQTESTRSTSLSVAGGGMTRTVGASQAAGVVTWNYYCGYWFKYCNSKNFWKCLKSVIDWVGDITDPFPHYIMPPK